jgi:hypothetical protein
MRSQPVRQQHAVVLAIRRPDRTNADFATAHFITRITAAYVAGKIRKTARFGERVRDI